MRSQLESLMQSNFFACLRFYSRMIPELDLVFAVPNGGHRDIRVARRMKGEGVRAGVWDIFVPIPRNGCPGLWLEFKVGRGKLSPAQQDWGKAMRAQGYRTEVIYDDWRLGWAVLVDYLGLKENPQ
jgi:hypothetical protein